MAEKTSIRQGYKNKFTSVSNKLAQNNDLSLKARGLMLYFLSLPDDWIIYVDQLAKVMKEGKCAILSGLAELKKAGYVHHTKLGFKEGWQYFTFGEPISEEEFKLFLRTTRFSNSSETEQFGNQQLQNTNLKNKEHIYIQNKERERTSKISLPKIERLPNVLTTEEEHLKLEKELGIHNRDECYKILSNWKEITPKSKWKKGDYLSILRWVVNALKEKRAKQDKETIDGISNLEYAKSIENKLKTFKSSNSCPVRVEACNSYFEFVLEGCQAKPFCLTYDTPDFKNKLDEALKHYKLL